MKTVKNQLNLNADQFQEHFSNIKTRLQSKEPNKVLPFPIQIFPEVIQEIIKATHHFLRFPVDFMASSILYTTAVSIGNTHWLKVKNKWYERPILFMAIVGKPGTMKSHPLSWCNKPLESFDSVSLAKYEKETLDYTAYMEMSRQEKMESNAEPLQKPVYQKFLVADTTPESIFHVHKHNKRGIGVCVDELAGWFKNFDRYTKGSEQESWLSTWSAKPIVIDRKSEAPTNIKSPCISVIGTIQEAIISDLGGNNRNRNGFIDRILYVFPDGLKKEKWIEEDLPEVFAKSWHTIIEALIKLELGFDENHEMAPSILKLSPESSKQYKEWHSASTDLCNAMENETLAGFYIKLEQYCLRFALILQVLDNITSGLHQQEISKKNMEGAIQLTEYFRSTVNKMYEVVFEGTLLDHLPMRQSEFYKSLPLQIKTQQAVAIGKTFNLSERCVKRLLDPRNKFFIRLSQGVYEKLYP